ncbi:MAG TPA: mannosyltransferase family protein [Aggregatilineales bacterium]|nr:mannosyltransferase family protein [Aggregatilineales bacterium]
MHCLSIESQHTKLPRWLTLLIILIALRLVLNGVAWIASQTSDLGEGVFDSQAPQHFPMAWVRWDANYYLQIATHGYDFQDPKLAFFPLYALGIRYLSLGNPDVFVWVGLLISNGCFMAACLLLYKQVKTDYNERIGWWSAVAMACYPTAFYFNALYPEALFILLSIAVYWFACRSQYGWSAVCVALASITRPVGLLLLIIPLVELLARRPKHLVLHLVGILTIGSLGVGLYALYLWGVHGSPIAFAQAQSEWGGSWVIPGTGFITSMQVTLGLAGEPADWFMRVVSLHDWVSSLLFLILTVVAYRWVRHSLFLYMFAGMLLLLVLHGPFSFGLWSMPRYVVALYPGFILLGIFLAYWPRLRWVILTGSVGLLVFFTAWFATGRWVA